MKFVVVRGFQEPWDKSRKYRYAVVLGMVNGRMAIAPCTTAPGRKGFVPQGCALLTDNSPAYEGSGFNAQAIGINIRETGLYAIDSRFVRRCRQAGVLDTSKDLRLQANLMDLMKTYDLLHTNKEFT